MVPFAGLLAALEAIPDPRRRQGRRYPLAHLLLFSVLAVLATTVMLALVAGGPAWAASHSVSMTDFKFTPKTLTISVRDSVTWTNDAQDPHTSTSDSGLWDSGSVSPGQSYTHTFNSAGTFPYHCTFHQSLGIRDRGRLGAQPVLPAAHLVDLHAERGSFPRRQAAFERTRRAAVAGAGRRCH